MIGRVTALTSGRAKRPPYKLLSLLLQYPSDGLLEARPSLGEAIARLPRSQEHEKLERFFISFEGRPEFELQQDYVETFDLQKRSSLYLTFYTHGDTRKRGLAMLRLKRLYQAAGLILQRSDLPDYLPVMLEFAELAPVGVGRQLLAEHRVGLEVLRLALKRSKSPYLHLLDAICLGLSRLGLGDLEAVRRLLLEGPPSEQVGLQPFAPAEVMPAPDGVAVARR
jgi:nitrate reductase molybdenum cofactor assembly chaperone NarJ/NarW